MAILSGNYRLPAETIHDKAGILDLPSCAMPKKFTNIRSRAFLSNYFVYASQVRILTFYYSISFVRRRYIGNFMTTIVWPG